MTISHTHRLLVLIISTCAIVSTAYAESGRTDYDLDDDGLIEINSLADLNEIRNNLDGTTLYGESVGCPAEGCNGFELTTTLDFDTNADGVMDENDTYWNDGEGWEPIGFDRDDPFTAIFEGNGHPIRNLYIDRPTSNYVGLFGAVRGASSTLHNVVLTGPLMRVNGGILVGSLVGYVYDSSVINSISTGSVVGNISVGSLVGYVYDSSVTNSITTGSVVGDKDVGSLVGSAVKGSSINNSIATGSVVGIDDVGGLVGYASGVEVFNSHWATDTTGQEFSAVVSEADSYFGATLAELQCPISSDDTECLVGNTLYSTWDSSVWDFGSNQELPGLIINGVVYRDSDGDGSLDINQAPEVVLLLKQDGDVVMEVIEGEGDVTIEANITDPDLSDRHKLSWTLSDFSIVGETDNTKATFSSDNLIDGEYTVSVVVTDNRFSPLSANASITFQVIGGVAAAPSNSSKSSSGGGAINLYWLLMMGGLIHMRSCRRRMSS